MPPRKKRTYELPPGRLWPNTPSGNPLEIEVFGATGEYASGKTLLGLSIAPGVHPKGHDFAGQPRMLLLDFEKSAGAYGGAKCQRVDVPVRMLELHGGKYGPRQVFDWFLETIEKVKPGQFDVIMADPVTDVEAGMVEYVKVNCQQFGLTSKQVDKAGGLLWGAVKDYWKQVLLKLSTRCRCFYFTSHLRDEWKGDRPSGRRERKGKETLMELASLYVWLERKPDAEGNVPAVPSAICEEPWGKNRISDTWIDDKGGFHIDPLLPPRISKCTVDEIRCYIANPPDHAKLKDGERVREEEFTEEEKLRLEVVKAEAERDTEGSRLAQLTRRAELQSQMQVQGGTTNDNPSGTTTQLATDDSSVAEKEKADVPPPTQEEVDKAKAEADEAIEAVESEGKRLAAEAPPETAMEGTEAASKATRGQVKEIERLFGELTFNAARQAKILGMAKVAEPGELARKDANFLIERLIATVAEHAKQESAGN